MERVYRLVRWILLIKLKMARGEHQGYWPIRKPDGSLEEIPMVVVDEELSPTGKSRRAFLIGGGLMASGIIVDGGLFGFSFTKRGVREFFRLLSSYEDDEVVSEVMSMVVPTATAVETEQRIIPQLRARIEARQVTSIENSNGKDPQLIAQVREVTNRTPQLRVYVRNGDQNNRNNAIVVPVELSELNISIPADRRLLIPPEITTTYWNGNRVDLMVPENVWELVLNAAIHEDINPYLLLALFHSESSSFGCGAQSPVGATGCFQFMPATWTVYGEGSINDPIANSIAAAKMIKAIGLVGNFGVGREAFIANFVGDNRQACWNMDRRQAAYVYDTAVALMEAAKARGDFLSAS
jgi:hypothetical protein